MIENLFLMLINANASILLWIFLIPVILIFGLLIVALVIRIVKMNKLHKVSKGVTVDYTNKDEFYDAYGGRDNILTINQEMSRITVTVNDVDLINANTLKELGATGVLITGNAIKASFGENAEEVYNIIKVK